MEPILFSDNETVEDTHDEEAASLHNWRVEQLRRLGVSRSLAEEHAELVDWHEMDELIARGCPPELALEIAR